MITVAGDMIYFDGRPVAAILVRPGTLRDQFVETVEATASDYIRRIRQAVDNLEELTGD